MRKRERFRELIRNIRSLYNREKLYAFARCTCSIQCSKHPSAWVMRYGNDFVFHLLPWHEIEYPCGKCGTRVREGEIHIHFRDASKAAKEILRHIGRGLAEVHGETFDL